MAVITPRDYVGFDHRWRQWAKTITSATDIDLSKQGGWALVAEFAQFSGSVALSPGDVLVVGSETGSHRYHSYEYAGVIGLDRDHAVTIDTDLAHYSEFQKWRKCDACPEEWAAEARNSAPYRYGLFWHWLNQVIDADVRRSYIGEWIEIAKAEAAVVTQQEDAN